MYSYEVEKPKLFTEDGQAMVLKAWDNAQRLLHSAGAFMLFSALDDIHYGDSWTGMAIIDRLVELGYIREVTNDVAGQDRVFVRK